MSQHRDDERSPGDEPIELFSDQDGDRLRSAWESAQTAFVDDPRGAVRQADALVAQMVESLSSSFTAERSRLEQQWDSGDEVSTEDLRVALQRYRSFFDRLLSV